MIAWAVAGVLWRLPRIGLRVYPYVEVHEGATPVDLPPLPDSLQAGWATDQDIEALESLWSGHMGTTRPRLKQRFASGNRCFALRDGDSIPAAMWCDLEVLSHEPEERPLVSDEVYLFDAYVSPAARGRNLAPSMRAACYDACRALGRTRMLSYTDYFNESSHRFKAKLGARRARVRVQVVLFGRWSGTFTLWRYRNPSLGQSRRGQGSRNP